MARPRLAVLGGSTPYAAALFDAIATAATSVSPMDLVLFGRDTDALHAMTGYCEHQLGTAGWSVTGTTDLARALDAADIVIHQIRYGGMEARLDDERVAAEIGVAADETLGPAGLRAAIRTARGLAPVARALDQRCPGAFVVNLTNPLSCSTAQLATTTRCTVVGVCELPRLTKALACATLGIPDAATEWEYCGLNHRGFIVGLVHEGRDRLDELPRALRSQSLNGVDADVIAELGALPLKYFPLLIDPGRRRAANASRARILLEVRAQILEELRVAPSSRPPSLDRRDQPWYADAVVPIVQALRAPTPSSHVVSSTDADGIARERRATVSQAGVVHRDTAPVNARVGRWIQRFEDHERAVLRAAADPSVTTVRAALEVDPMLDPKLVRRATTVLTRSLVH
jgi:6-phospho-beta-glucosidase